MVGKNDAKIMDKIKVIDTNGKSVSEVSLDKSVFDGSVNHSVLHQTIVMYNANKRVGTAKAKTRSYVRGGGKKPWKQKGTGRARVGSIRSPLWKGGGVIFPPMPRDYSYSVPKKIRRSALCSSLNSLVSEGNLILVDEFKLKTNKTKALESILKNIGVKSTCLIVVSDVDENLHLSSRNIPYLRIRRVKDLNALDVLSTGVTVMTKDAFKSLNEALVKNTGCSAQ